MKDYPMLKEQIISAKNMFENGTDQPFMAFGVIKEIFNNDIAMQYINITPIIAGCNQPDFLSEKRWLDQTMTNALSKTKAIN